MTDESPIESVYVDDEKDSNSSEEKLLQHTEMENLAQHLADQVEYNNQLLSQVQELERQQLKHQKDSRTTKQGRREALALSNVTKRENAELQHRLGISQEIANRMAEEGKATRIQATEYARQIEILKKEKQRLQLEYNHVQEEREAFQSQIVELSRESATLRLDQTRFETEEAAIVAKLRLALETRTNEFELLQSKHGPLIAEADKMRRIIIRSQEENEHAASSLKAMSNRVNVAEKKLSKYAVEGQAAASRIRNLETALSEARSRNQVVQRDVVTSRNQVISRGEELGATRQALTELTQQIQIYEQTLNEKDEELLKKESEIKSIISTHNSERATFSQEQDDLRKQLAMARQATRDNEQGFQVETERIANDYEMSYKAREEEYLKLQTEFMKLHHLQQIKQQQAVEHLREIEIERAQHESQIAETRALLHAQQRETSRACDTLREFEADRLAERRSIRAETAARTDRHIQMLSALLDTIRQMKSEVTGTERSHAELSENISQLRAIVDMEFESKQGNESDYYYEVKKSLHALVNTIKFESEEVADVRKKLRNSEIRVEQSSKITTIQSQNAEAMNRDLNILRDQLADTEAEARSKLRTKDSEMKAVATLRNDLQTRLIRTESQLEFLRAQTMALQEDLHKSNSSLSDATSQLAGTEDAADERLTRASMREAKLISEKKELLREREQQRRRMKERQYEVDMLKVKLAEAKSGYSDADATLKDAERTNVMDIRKLSSAMKTMQNQIIQTKKLLNVVQQKNIHLQEDNKALRLELEAAPK